jgi:putative Mg2+ transporter-C (MgtC) family protein
VTAADVLQSILANAASLGGLLLSVVLGGIIGLERELSGKAAGFRTNLLICLGAALLTDLSVIIAGDHALNGGVRADPGRIAAQIVSGVGFLGAGTILQSRGSVTGLTTAATLWVVAAIGMAAGARAYVLAISGTLLVLMALRVLGHFGDALMPQRLAERTVRVVLQDRPELVVEIERQLADSGYRIRGIDVERGQDRIIASLHMYGPGGDYDRAVQELLRRDGVLGIELR